MALIEIDALPNFKNGGSFHGELWQITRVYIYGLWGSSHATGITIASDPQHRIRLEVN